MPLLKIFTNVNVADQQGFIRKSSEVIAGILKKPEQYVMVIFIPDTRMIFSTSQDPTLYMELKSIGLERENMKEITEKIMDFMAAETGIDPSRMFIEYTSVNPLRWGWNRDTME